MRKRFHSLKKLLALLFAAALLFACGCAEEPKEKQLFAMDTFMQLRAYGSGAAEGLKQAEDSIKRLDALLSATDEGSEIYALNCGAGAAEVSAETYDILQKTLSLSKELGDCFEITIRPVMLAWGFTGGETRVPSDGEIAAALALVGDERITLRPDGRTVEKPEGVMIDLGAAAKGCAADAAAELMREAGVTSALLDLGSSTITAIGSKPGGKSWRIAVRDPNDAAAYAGIISAEDISVSTSGGYERFFTDDAGNKYWHIIDPTTGRPAHSGALSVTVISESAFYGDVLSTALFVMGPAAAEEYWRARGDFDFIMLLEDGSILITPGAAEVFKTQGAWADADMILAWTGK